MTFSPQAGHHCGDNIDLVEGQPTGCVRISFGNMSVISDATTFIEFVSSCFVDVNVGWIRKGKEGGGGSVDSSGAEMAVVSPSGPEGSYRHVIGCGDSISAVSTSGNTVTIILHHDNMIRVCRYCSGTSAGETNTLSSQELLWICSELIHVVASYASVGGATRHTVIGLSVVLSVCYTIFAAHAER